MKHLDDLRLGRIHQKNAEHNEGKLKHEDDTTIFMKKFQVL